MLEVVRVNLPLRALPEGFEGLTIGQISDFHLGPFVGRDRVRAAVDAVMSLNPELIVAIGDYVTQLVAGEAGALTEELSRLAAPLGVLAILGNHDHWTNPETVTEALQAAGLTVLRNANVPLHRQGDTVYVAGLDDVWEEKHDLAASLSGIPDNACIVLLAHEPDIAAETSRDRRVVLQISGHSHGGQIRLPFYGPLHLPHFARKYGQGLQRVRDMRLYTNRGIGVVSPPVRLNCRPEVTLFTLTMAR